MKVNLVDVVEKILDYSDRNQLVAMMSHGLWELNGEVVTDYNVEYEVSPGDKLKLWKDKDSSGGGTYIYFAPAILEDLKIFGVKTPGGGRRNIPAPNTVVIPDGLTIKTHSELLGSRFRMTNLEREKHGKDRDAAFKERYNRHPLTGDKL